VCDGMADLLIAVMQLELYQSFSTKKKFIVDDNDRPCLREVVILPL
jgi:hypothetical protein